MKPWGRVSSRTVLRTPIFAVRAEEWRPPRGARGHTFYFLDAPDWINVIPVDDRGRVVLIRQHRYGSRRLELEIPGGAMDRRDRRPLDAAKRELLEETGCVARRWASLGWAHPNPAFHRNRCHMFLALGVRRVAGQTLDHAEEIAVTSMPLAAIPPLIRRGGIRHALVIAAFHALLSRPALLKRLPCRPHGEADMMTGVR